MIILFATLFFIFGTGFLFFGIAGISGIDSAFQQTVIMLAFLISVICYGIGALITIINSLSNRNNKKIEDNIKKLNNTVEVMEKELNKIYKDTFDNSNTNNHIIDVKV